MQPTERNRQLNKARYDVLSITGYVIKKNPTHGARHGTSMRQRMYYKAPEMLKKARKHKNGGYENILDRWHKRWQIPQVFVRYWVGWGTDHRIRWNRIRRPFLRGYTFVCGYMAGRKSERTSLEKFFECRRYSRANVSAQWLYRSEANCKRLYHEHTAITGSGNKPISPGVKALKNTITDLKLPQDGDTILLPRRIHLRHHDGNQAANCGQLGVGIRGTRHPGLNSFFFFLHCSEMSFRLPEI